MRTLFEGRKQSRPKVNFTNILAFCHFTFTEKLHTQNVSTEKLRNTKSWSQFHQRFTRAFLCKILAPKITKLCFVFEIFWRQNIGKKSASKMFLIFIPCHQLLVKLTYQKFKRGKETSCLIYYSPKNGLLDWE
jgi:hypothetical protein